MTELFQHNGRHTAHLTNGTLYVYAQPGIGVNLDRHAVCSALAAGAREVHALSYEDGKCYRMPLANVFARGLPHYRNRRRWLLVLKRDFTTEGLFQQLPRGEEVAQ